MKGYRLEYVLASEPDGAYALHRQILHLVYGLDPTATARFAALDEYGRPVYFADTPKGANDE